MNNSFIISVDLGGTNVLSALLNDKLEIVNRNKIPTDISKGTDQLVDSIAESVKELINSSHIDETSIKAICMGVPGTVNPEGLIGNAPNLNIKNFNIRTALQKFFNIPIFIENDVNLAALGIKKFEFDDKLNNALVVFVGTGIGGGLIFNGKIYRGSTFFAGEIGHMKVEESGSFSSDAKDSTTTFEGIASRTAVVESITKDIMDGKDSYLSKFVKKNKRIKSKQLLKAVNKKDDVATKHLKNAAKTIGTVLGSLTTLLNVDTIVLGGGVIEALDEYMMPRIEKAFHKAVLPEPGKDVKLCATKLGDDAPLFGGFSLAEEFIKE